MAAAFVLRALVPAGRLPWQALRRSPRLVRRSLLAGLAVVVATIGLLTGYAAGGPLMLPIVAVAAAPLLWACMMLERLGHVRSTAGDRHALGDWRREFGEALAALRAWPAETRRELHDAWHASDDEEREQKRRRAEARRPLAVYRNSRRNAILSAAFGLAALAVVVARPAHATWLALVLLYVSVRLSRMKAIATPAGLILDGPLGKSLIRWDRVDRVVDAPAPPSRLIHAPTLLLTDGRWFVVRQAAWRDAERAHGVAAELEAIRQTYRPVR